MKMRKFTKNADYLTKLLLLFMCLVAVTCLTFACTAEQNPSTKQVTSPRSPTPAQPTPTQIPSVCNDSNNKASFRHYGEHHIRQYFKEQGINVTSFSWDTDPLTGDRSPGISNNRRLAGNNYGRMMNSDVIINGRALYVAGFMTEDCRYIIAGAEVK